MHEYFLLFCGCMCIRTKSAKNEEITSIKRVSLPGTLEISERIAPPLDEDEKISLVFEFPRHSYFASYSKMFKNNVAFALMVDGVAVGVMGAFWDLAILPGPRHFIYTVIDHEATSLTSVLIGEVKKHIVDTGFSMRRVGFSFYPRLHDKMIYDSFRCQGFTPTPMEHRMKLDLPCKFQPCGLDKRYSVESATEDSVFEHLAVFRSLIHSKPFPEAYQEVVSDPDFTTRPYDPSMTICFTARCRGEPVGGMAICFIAEVAYVMNMIVSPVHRRRGIAQNMLREASSIAAQKGCLAMLVSSADNTAAVNLYSKIGFHEIGNREGFICSGN